MQVHHYFKTIVYFLVLLVFSCIHISSCETHEQYIYDLKLLKDGFITTVERGAINKNGINDATMSCYEQWVRSAFYIKTNGATSVSIPIKRSGQCFVWQYDSKYRVISYDEMRSEIPLLSNCEYIRFQIRASNTPQYVSVRIIESEFAPCEIKLVQKNYPSERLIYAVNDDIYTTARLILPPNYCNEGKSVPLIIWDSGDGSFMDWETHEIGDGYAGRINGLNYLRDNGFAVLEIYSWGSYYYKKYPGCGGRSAMPIPTHLATHEKGVEYVLSRFNIDKDNIFHVSKSGSGKIALYYAMVPPSFNLKAIYTFAPVFDDLNFVGWSIKGYREALFEELGLEGTDEEIRDFIEGTPYDFDLIYKKEHNLNIELSRSWQMHSPLGKSFIKKNADKFQMVSVNWMNVPGIPLSQKIEDTHKFSKIFWDGYNRHYSEDLQSFYFKWENNELPAMHKDSYTRRDFERLGCGIPFTVIMSPTDEQTPYWNALEVVKQFQNAGEDAYIISLKSGGHSGPDLSIDGPNTVKDVITRLGNNYPSVSIGWYYIVKDIYKRFILA